MQPGVVPGAVTELHAAKAALGTGPGINDPLTMQWFDTSGNLNHGALYSVPVWNGTGPLLDPYRLTLDGVNDCVDLPSLKAYDTLSCTYEVWVVPGAAGSPSYRCFIGEDKDSGNYCELAFLETENRPVFQTFTGGTLRPVFGGVVLTDGLPHHIVGVLTPTSHNIYVDLAPTVAAGPAGTFVSTTTTVGYLQHVGHQDNGSVLVARIYPFAFTAEQVAQNYAAGPVWSAVGAEGGAPVAGLIAFDGNSLTYGDLGEVVHGVNDYPTQCVALLGGHWVYRWPYMTGANTTGLIANAPTWHDPYCSGAYSRRICVFFEGINSMNSAVQTPEMELALWHTYCDARRAAGFGPIVVCTLPAGNAPELNGNAIAQGYASWDELRQDFNVKLRAGYKAFADGLADIGADPILGNVANCGDGIYFSDQLHLTAAGYAIVARYVADAIERQIDPAAASAASADAKLDDVLLKTNTLGAHPVTVTSPVAASGTITLSANDDYHTAHGRSIPFDIDDPTHALGLDDVDASVELRCSQATWTATAVETTGGYHVDFEIPHAGLTRSGHYQLKCMLADGDVVTKAKGEIVLERDIPAVAAP